MNKTGVSLKINTKRGKCYHIFTYVGLTNFQKFIFNSICCEVVKYNFKGVKFYNKIIMEIYARVCCKKKSPIFDLSSKRYQSAKHLSNEY